MLSFPLRQEQVSLDENMPGHLAILGRVEVSYELAWLTASEGSVLRQNRYHTDEFKRKRKRRIIVYTLRSLVMVREPVARESG